MEAIYHWWGAPSDAPAYANLRAPILVSIATLRAVNPDINITIIDSSHDCGEYIDNEWLHFPDKLNFTVSPYMNRDLYDHRDKIPGWMHLSRVPILDTLASVAFPSKATMYVDSDVFFLQDPRYLAGDTSKICFNGWNTGFFYYSANSATVQKFFEIFRTYLWAAIYSKDVRQVMKKYVGYDAWYGVWDEMIFTYMAHEHPELFDIIPVEEHATAKTIQHADLTKLKMFHANGTMVANQFAKIPGEREHCRGLLGILVKEFYDNITKVLDEKDLALIYTDAERRHYLPQQFSLLQNLEQFRSILGPDGHYHVQKLLRPVRMI